MGINAIRTDIVLEIGSMRRKCALDVSVDRLYATRAAEALWLVSHPPGHCSVSRLAVIPSFIPPPPSFVALCRLFRPHVALCRLFRPHVALCQCYCRLQDDRTLFPSLRQVWCPNEFQWRGVPFVICAHELLRGDRRMKPGRSACASASNEITALARSLAAHMIWELLCLLVVVGECLNRISVC